MFDNYVFTDGTARNVTTASGQDAFQAETLITYYRGIPLSMVHDVDLIVDGSSVPRDELAISVGDDWFTLAEATTVTGTRWEYGTPMTVRWVDHPLPDGDHEVTMRLRIRVAYIPIPFGGERTRIVTI